jgi:hypothetical protein
MYPHTIASVDTDTIKAEAGLSSVVKHKRRKPLKSGQRVFVLNIFNKLNEMCLQVLYTM